jgi:hypothetical protein
MRLEAKNGMKLDIDILAEGGKNKPKLAIAYCPHLDSLHETYRTRRLATATQVGIDPCQPTRNRTRPG